MRVRGEADRLHPERIHDATVELTPSALTGLAGRLADKRVVMIGEASHGTSEFYTLRAELTKRLIAEHGFGFVGVEGDWPACTQLHAYVQGADPAPVRERKPGPGVATCDRRSDRIAGEAAPAHEANDGAAARAARALEAFDRWPAWMWANWEVAAFAGWLRRHNEGAPVGARVGFYGLDVYSLHASLEAVVAYLEQNRPDAVETARRAFACFEPYRRGGEDFPDLRLVPSGCEGEVVALLAELQRGGDGAAHFDAEQNARIALNAERYYRAALRGGGSSWNVRDRHMHETLEHLLDAHGADAKAVVWAHNTHVGDAAYTDMADAGMVNIGQLAREAFGRDEVALVGLGTHRGSVLAGTSWGAAQEAMEVPPAAEGSWEAAFHAAGRERALLLSDDVRDDPAFLRERDHRAIGVVYRPAREHFGNYVPTVLPERYDAFIHVDVTGALHPTSGPGATDRPPATFPWAL